MKEPKKSIKERFLSLPIWFWVVFIAVLCVGDSVRRYAFGGGCLLMDIFRFPCPTCGMSRAIFYAMILRFDIAINYNPAFWVAPLCLICLTMAFIDKKHPKLWFIVFSVLIVILLVVWVVYRIIMRVPI